MSYLQKYVFRKNPKDINFKEFNMTSGKNEAKTMLRHISFDCKCNEMTNYRKYKKDYRYNPNTCTCENNKCLKGIDTSVMTSDEIISVMENVSTKITNTIATNVSTNFEDKNVRYKVDCYILHTVLLVIKLLLMITIICYYYAKHRSKQKSIDELTI